MKKAIIYILITFSLSGLLTGCKKNNGNYVVINKTKVYVEIASHPDSQYQGLSDREKICSDCGMLFVFDKSLPKTFVMRRMKFPLDIIWINNDKIIKIDKNLPPEGETPTYKYDSNGIVDKVLEVNAGISDKYEFKIGDSIKYFYGQN